MLGYRLRKAREAQHITMREMAKQIGCSSMFLCDLERGKRNITIKWLCKINSILRLKEFNMFERSELQQLEQRALDMERVTPNHGWKRAYLDFAYACNVLDAFMGRITENGIEPGESD